MTENDKNLIRKAKDTLLDYNYIGSLMGHADSAEAREILDDEYKRAFTYEERRCFDHDID